MKHVLMLISITLYSITFCFAQDNKNTKESTVSVNKTVKETTTGTLKLYPNPAKDYTNIYVDWNTAQTFSIIVYDLQFQTQLTEIPVSVRKSYQYALNVKQLPEGKYKITVKSSVGTLEETLTVKR